MPRHHASVIRHLPFVILSLAAIFLLAGPTTAPSTATALTDFETRHLYHLGIGHDISSNQSAQADVDLVSRALQLNNSDPKTRQNACLAVEKLTRFLNADQSASLAPSVIPCLTDSDPDTREFAARALSQLAPHLPEKLVTQSSDQFLKLLASKDPDDNRRGALLAAAFAPRLAPAQLEASVKALAVNLDKKPDPANHDDTYKAAQTAAHSIDIRALAASAPSVRDPELAQFLVNRLLPVAGLPNESSAGTHPQVALAHLYPLVDDKSQSKILALILEHLDDPKLVYSRTSGIRTPFRHLAADALLVAIPRLNVAEREKVHTRILEARASLEKSAALQKSDLDNIFPPLLTALESPTTQPSK